MRCLRPPAASSGGAGPYLILAAGYRNPQAAVMFGAGDRGALCPAGQDGGALEDRQLAGLAGDERDGLDARRAVAVRTAESTASASPGGVGGAGARARSVSTIARWGSARQERAALTTCARLCFVIVYGPCARGENHVVTPRDERGPERPADTAGTPGDNDNT
jgi:hypothetical protein